MYNNPNTAETRYKVLFMSQPEWMQQLQLSKNTGYIQIYTDAKLKEKLEEEAEEQGCSVSEIGAELLVEALAIREQPKRLTASNNEEDELREKVEQLEQQLEAEKQDTEISLKFDEQDLKQHVLTENCQTLEEIKHEIAKQGFLDEAVLKPLENQLWKLVAADEVEYDRVHGWKLKEGGE